MTGLSTCGAICGLLLAVSASAQEAPLPATQLDEHPVADTVEFLAGGALAFGLHESAHLVFDAAFDAHPELKGVHLGPVQFFAITHNSGMSTRQEFAIDSAGFWVQEATNEWLLTTHPNLRREHAPVAKGMLAFNVLASIGYSLVGLAGAGPPERDTRGMAASIGVSERAIAFVVLTPAVLDAYRYFRPDSAWAKWASRVSKVGGLALILK
jgi:hypothetical protein